MRCWGILAGKAPAVRAVKRLTIFPLGIPLASHGRLHTPGLEAENNGLRHAGLGQLGGRELASGRQKPSAHWPVHHPVVIDVLGDLVQPR